MRTRRLYRRLLAVLILLLILAAAGWTGLWYVVAGRVAANVMAWEQRQRAEGWTITQGPPRRVGWPMAAGVSLPDITISGGASYLPGGLAWQAGGLTLALDIRHLNRLYWGVTGRQSIRVAQGPAIPFQAARCAGQVALFPGDRPRLVQGQATGLILAIPAADGTARPLFVASLDAAMTADGRADAGGQALVVAARMAGIDLPPHLVPGLGRSLQSLSFDAALSGPVLAAPDPVLRAAAWSRAGGSLALRAVHLADGPLTLDGQGRFQLDAVLRPEGTAALHLAGVDAMVARLAATGVLTRPEARAVRAVLDLMMRPAGGEDLEAPMSLRDGIVSLGAIPLLRLPVK
jgi:hypothetical protein